MTERLSIWLSEIIQGESSEFSALKRSLAKYMAEEQIHQIERAYYYARAAHEGQFRQSGEPYITHPTAAAMLLAHFKIDQYSIMAALLHDVIEDTSIERNEIQAEFGEEVAYLVDGVSKLTKIELATRSDAAAENFCKMVMAMGRDIRVIIVKLADRLHNMRTLNALSPQKRRAKGLETIEIYAPIANRLGMHQIYTDFEDLGFEALYPMRFKILKENVDKLLADMQPLYQQCVDAINTRFTKHHLQVQLIEWRKRHLYSIYKKMRDERMSLQEIIEKLPLRIIVTDIDTCYRTLGVLHNLYKPHLEQFKDYIAIPKANGYRALHTTLLATGISRHAIPIEVQIRSTHMHRLAEFGIIAHWYEKQETGKMDRAHIRAQAWMNSLLEMHKNTGTPQEFVAAVKNDLFPDEVYIFTPKGKILELPKGASPVDFAYAIHSDIGNTCVAAKIDRRLSPLSTPILNGQTVEIITAPGARPNPSWLNFVVTGKARANIRQYLKGQQRSESIHLGQVLLEKALESFQTNMVTIPQTRIQEIVTEMQYHEFDDLLEDIGLGNQMSMVIAKRLLGELQSSDIDTENIKPIYIKGSQGMVVTFAECCYPIPGDPIIAVMQSGQGIVIHNEQCQKLSESPSLLAHHIPALWEENVNDEFKVEIELEASNQRGSLAKIASAVSADADIDDITMTETAERCARVNLIITVQNRTHLAKILRRLRNQKNVLKVFRKR